MNKITTIILVALLFVSCGGQEKGNKNNKKEKEMAADSIVRDVKKFIYIKQRKTFRNPE